MAFIERSHELRMIELQFERESNKLYHEMELERIRIKSAEIKRSIDRKANANFCKQYTRQ